MKVVIGEVALEVTSIVDLSISPLRLMKLTINRGLLIAFTTFSVVVLIFLFSSCEPDLGSPTPRNYELYVRERDQYPAFSPDGNFIVYCHFSNQLPEPDDYPSGLYLINRDGSNQRRLVRGQFFSPAWSPDGQWITFTNGLLMKCKTDGDSVVSYSETGIFFPDYTPDGSKIIFDRISNPAGTLSIINSKLVSESELFSPNIPGARDPEFSPDGKTLLFTQGSGDWESTEVVIREVNTSESNIRLTNDNASDTGPSWSPAGDKIVWSSNVRIMKMNKDGTEVTTLSYGQYPSWSIHNVIVFSHTNNDYTREVLYTISPDGSNKTQITF